MINRVCMHVCRFLKAYKGLKRTQNSAAVRAELNYRIHLSYKRGRTSDTIQGGAVSRWRVVRLTDSNSAGHISSED